MARKRICRFGVGQTPTSNPFPRKMKPQTCCLRCGSALRSCYKDCPAHIVDCTWCGFRIIGPADAGKSGEGA